MNPIKEIIEQIATALCASLWHVYTIHSVIASGSEAISQKNPIKEIIEQIATALCASL